MNTQEIKVDPSSITPSEGKVWQCSIIAISIFAMIYGALKSLPHPPPYLDFAPFYLSGLAWRKGLPIYDSLSQNAIIDQLQLFGCYPNLNPPAWVLFFALHALFSPKISFFINYAFTLALPSALLFISRKQGSSCLFLALLAGSSSLWATAALGQVYHLLLGLTWYLLISITQRKEVVASYLMGVLILLKPNLGLTLIPCLVLGHSRFVTRTILSTLGLTAISVLVFGVNSHLDWLNLLLNIKLPYVGTNASIWQVPLPSLVPIACIAIITIGLLNLQRSQHNCSLSDACYLGLSISLLISPISWVGYILILWPFLIRRSSQPIIVCAVILTLFPANMMFTLSWDFAVLRFVYPTALTLIVTDALLACSAKTGPK